MIEKSIKYTDDSVQSGPYP